MVMQCSASVQSFKDMVKPAPLTAYRPVMHQLNVQQSTEGLYTRQASGKTVRITLSLK